MPKIQMYSKIPMVICKGFTLAPAIGVLDWLMIGLTALFIAFIPLLMVGVVFIPMFDGMVSALGIRTQCALDGKWESQPHCYDSQKKIIALYIDGHDQRTKLFDTAVPKCFRHSETLSTRPPQSPRPPLQPQPHFLPGKHSGWHRIPCRHAPYFPSFRPCR